MQLRPATLIIVAAVAALFGFAGAASRSCAPVEGALAHTSGAATAGAVKLSRAPSSALQQ